MAKKCWWCRGDILSEHEQFLEYQEMKSKLVSDMQIRADVDRYMRPGQVIEDEAWIRGFKAGALGQLDELEQTYDRMLERVRADKADGEGEA